MSDCRNGGRDVYAAPKTMTDSKYCPSCGAKVVEQ